MGSAGIGGISIGLGGSGGAARAFRHLHFFAGHAAAGRELNRACARHVDQFGPSAYSILAKDVQARAAESTPAVLLALLKLGGGDPMMVARLEEPLLQAVRTADAEERAGFIAVLEKAWANYYSLGGRRHRDAAFVLGRLFRRLGRPDRALECNRASLEEFGPHCSTLRNAGACYEDLGDREQALCHYRQAMELRPDVFAAEAITRIESANSSRRPSTRAA